MSPHITDADRVVLATLRREYQVEHSWPWPAEEDTCDN